MLENGLVRVLKSPPFGRIELSKATVAFKKITLLAPAGTGKIILAGLNYKDHARELKMELPKEPVIFLKPVSALLGHRQNIIYPATSGRVDYEAELALVIKKKARFVRENKAASYILGFTCLNDVTERDLQKKDIQWTRAKSFDTFCPLGPWLETTLDPSALRIRSYLNGEIRQDSSTKNLIFSVPYLVSFISSIMTLEPGDVISTGTPPGVGSLLPGDNIRIEIEGIGTLENRVAAQRRK